MAYQAFIKTAFTGGTTNALDGIDGNNVNVNDMAFVHAGEQFWPYQLSTGASTENSPRVITPDSNPGSKCWLLQDDRFSVTTTSSAPSILARGITIISSTKNAVGTIAVPSAGVKKTIISRTTRAVNVKTNSTSVFIGSTAYRVVTISNTTKSKKFGGRSFSAIAQSTILWQPILGSTAGLSFAMTT